MYEKVHSQQVFFSWMQVTWTLLFPIRHRHQLHLSYFILHLEKKYLVLVFVDSVYQILLGMQFATVCQILVASELGLVSVWGHALIVKNLAVLHAVQLPRRHLQHPPSEVLLEVACSEMVDAHAASAHVLTACEEESVVAAHPVPENLVAIDGEKEAGNAFERTFVGGSVVMGHPALDTLDCRAHESAVQAE